MPVLKSVEGVVQTCNEKKKEGERKNGRDFLKNDFFVCGYYFWMYDKNWLKYYMPIISYTLEGLSQSGKAPQ